MVFGELDWSPGVHGAAREEGAELARWAAGLGMHAVSTYLVAGAVYRTDSLSAAGRLALICYAVVVVRDRMLLGRADVDAARQAGALIGVVESTGEVSEPA